MYGARKSQRLTQYWNIKNFRHRCQKWDVLFINDQMVWFVKKPNEKLQRFVIILLSEVIYIHFYNWDRPLDLVLVGMTWLNRSLKLYSELGTISHLILTHNTQDSCSMNAYFISVIIHDQMWCVYLIACRSNPKRFLSILYVFESVFVLSCFEFLFKLHFACFSSKTHSKAFSREARE